MKKITILIALAIVSLAILSQSGVLDALLAFLLVGAIPGTNYSVPSGFMLLLMAVIPWLIIVRFVPTEIYTQKSKRSKSKAKKSMPRRRYSQI